MQLYKLLLMPLLVVACSEVSELEVQHAGSLRMIKHEGNISAKILLDTLETKNLYGLGAVDSLRGEITVINGKVYASQLLDTVTVANRDAKVSAALLAYTYIAKWDTVEISRDEELEYLVERISDERNLPNSFPFIVYGQPQMLEYHIVNFDTKKGSFKDHKEGALNDHLSNVPVTILGFYSTEAAGVYIHHDSKTHLHFVNEKTALTGHVDNLIMGLKGYKLLIPKL